ncbi:MAG: YgcG family protein [Betaproteobacteria bacterium]|nr:MAG: YgcG family protein [Betaproteobacteria bacterium]
MTSASRAFLAAAAALLFSAFAAAQLAVPALGARVTDQTGTLGTQQRAALEQKLAAFEAKKGSQVAVLIVPTTRPEAIEQYSIRVVEAWKLGRKGVDDGVLLLVAKDDRQLRIEVGRGLEGALPDAIAKRIVAEYITPRFKQGDFYGGILAGIDRILGTIEGEPLPAPREARLPGGAQFDWFELLVIAIIGISVVNGILRAMFGRFGAAALVGGAVGLLVWMFWTAAFIAVIGGLLAFVLSLAGGAGRGRHWSSGGGGGWSSGGGGGGGFSGGGGGFSGGGASGRW